jgi:uncharacterized protein (DUF983 family)
LAEPSPWVVGLRARCPRCGQGKLFSGYLRFADRCTSCGADLIADAGDGPAVFVMFIVGAIVTPLLLILQFAFKFSPWASVAAATVAAIALSLALLPPFKATLFALQWKNKASEATSADFASPDG